MTQPPVTPSMTRVPVPEHLIPQDGDAASNEHAAGLWAAAIRDAVRKERVALHLSLRQAASRSAGQIKATTLGAYERGERQMTLRVLHQLADLYEVPVTKLIPVGPISSDELEAAERLVRSLATLPDRHRRLLHALVDELQYAQLPSQG